MKSSILIGLLLGFGLVIGTILTKEDTSYFLNWSSFAITFGGTISAVIIYFSPHALKDAMKSLGRIFSEKQLYAQNIADKMVALSKQSHTSSLKSLLSSDDVQSNAFLKKGMTLVADRAKPEEIEEILVRESQSVNEMNIIAERVFRIAGGFAPMFGMMGTVIGLIAMLNRVEDPASIPAAMGLALVTTFYGLILSALVFKPLSGKIRDKNLIDTRVRDIIIVGVISIRNGENSLITKERISGYLH